MEALAQNTNKIDVEMMEDKRHLDVAAVGHLANQEDHDETPMQALRRHPWTCVWVVYGIWVLLCCSFDNSAAGSVVGIPRFRQDYGYAYEGDYVLPANWQSAYSGGPAAASVFGTFAGGCECSLAGELVVVLTSRRHCR
jgi:SP family general alpha glucoside:H+ symporter-like MFS transporter